MPKLLHFAPLVDVLGVSSEDLQLDVEPISIDELLAKLAQRGAARQRVVGVPRGSRIAVNESFTELDTLVRQSDGVALVVSADWDDG